MGLIDKFKDDKLSFKKFSKAFKDTLKDAYYQAYALGLRSTGSEAMLTAGGTSLVLPADRKWVESAYRHEMRYLNKFLDDIKKNRSPGRWPHRVGMYVATVGSIYYSGRVAATPPNHALFWIAKIDNRICPQCRYMAVNSPYTKYNIPITPASGYSDCLSNCRCQLAVRPVSIPYFRELRRTSVSRSTHLRRLRKALK